MREKQAREARDDWANTLSVVQWRDEHVRIIRNGQPAAMMVSPEWYTSAVAALERQESETP